MWQLLDGARNSSGDLERRPTASGSVKRQQDDLETRVETRKRQLITEIIEHKKNSSRYGAAVAIDKIKQHLTELSHIMKAVQPSNLDDGTRLRLLEWIAR